MAVTHIPQLVTSEVGFEPEACSLSVVSGCVIGQSPRPGPRVPTGPPLFAMWPIPHPGAPPFPQESSDEGSGPTLPWGRHVSRVGSWRSSPRCLCVGRGGEAAVRVLCNRSTPGLEVRAWLSLSLALTPHSPRDPREVLCFLSVVSYEMQGGYTKCCVYQSKICGLLAGYP